MARKREFDEAAVATEVVNLVTRYGYDAVSMDDIVRATGVGRGSIYAAFGSKAGLIAESLKVVRTRGRKSELDGYVALLLASSSIQDPQVATLLRTCLREMGSPEEQAIKIGTALRKRVAFAGSKEK